MAELRALRMEVNGRFDGMNSRIDGMAQRIDGMAERNDQQHARTAEQLSELNEMVTNIESETRAHGTVAQGARLLSETNASDIAQHVGYHARLENIAEGRQQIKDQFTAPIKEGIKEIPKVLFALSLIAAGGIGYAIDYLF